MPSQNCRQKIWVENIQRKAPSQNCSWKTCGWKVFSSEGAIPKLQVKSPDIKYYPKTADEKSCVRKVSSQNWRPNTEVPPMPLTACHWFQKVQNPDPNKLHNASKSCSRQQTPIKKLNGNLFSKWQTPLRNAKCSLWGTFNLMVKKLYFQDPKTSLRQSALR